MKTRNLLDSNLDPVQCKEVYVSVKVRLFVGISYKPALGCQINQCTFAQTETDAEPSKSDDALLKTRNTSWFRREPRAWFWARSHIDTCVNNLHWTMLQENRDFLHDKSHRQRQWGFVILLVCLIRRASLWLNFPGIQVPGSCVELIHAAS